MVTYFLDDRSYDGTIWIRKMNDGNRMPLVTNVAGLFPEILFSSKSVMSSPLLGATHGGIKCSPGSCWLMAIAAIAMIGLATVAGFGNFLVIGLFFGPVHSLLLGIGVDDWYGKGRESNR